MLSHQVEKARSKARSSRSMNRMNAAMSLEKEEWPEVGDLVIATVENVIAQGAYVRLDEYDEKGLLHVSEIASSWVRNIRDFVREGQKLVLKVLKVNTEKRQIDLSLRRVTKRERKEKIMSWKRERKAEALLRNAAERTGSTTEDVYERAGALMEREYGLYAAFEKTVREGAEVLTKIGVPEELAAVLADVATERIRIDLVKVKGTVELKCSKPNGVQVIREAFSGAEKSEKVKGAELRFYVIAAPRYRIEVLAENYKQAEATLERVANRVIANVSKAGGQGSFKRER